MAVTDGVREIPLVGIHGEGKVALVDERDFEQLSEYRWFHGGRWVGTNVREDGRSKKITMHRVIMQPPSDKVVDHINGDILDNRRENLRICTQAENVRNRGPDKKSKSGYKGVSYSKFHQKWTSYITLGKRKHIGYFDCKEEAARAYDYYALEYFEEFAWLNFPDEIPEEPKQKKLTSKYRGISWAARDKRYIGGFVYEGDRYRIGSHKTEKEAVIAYNKRVVEVMGEDAPTKLLDIKDSDKHGEE